ncbi:MAG: DNA repair protein RecN [Verrucomicrobia bacterium]|nr:MAG: DNA repair protein RecN [Verrucomicrobiota bacterium]
MLQSLRIRNLALLEAVELEFEQGFIGVTGETGAGKSILLGALSLLSGSRADKTIIRHGADFCEVEGTLHFTRPTASDALLDTLDLPPCEDGVLLIRRRIHASKPQRISVNGAQTTLANLQRIGEHWIDFHGPSEPRRLLKAEAQIELLDLFGKLTETAARYRDTFQHWKSLLAEIERLTSTTRLDTDQIDFLRGQIARIDSLDLDPEAIETLERDFTRLSRARELAELTAALAAGLTGEAGLLDACAPLVRTARELASVDPSTAQLVARLESLAVEIEDLGQEFESLNGSLEFDEEAAADLQTRMATLQELRRKYGTDPAAILEAREELAKRIAEQADLDGILARLHQEAAAAEKAAREQASALRVARDKAGKALARKAQKLLSQLGFARAALEVALTLEPHLRPHGDARPEFQFAPNVGQPPQPLARIASSGELARVMLALKTVLAEVDDVPVLVFDEVDANVGGEIGRVVGSLMARIAARHQVFCVTHLPQVAAQASQHFLVEKTQDGRRTSVSIRSIHEDTGTRIDELARMLGDRKAASALAHARELLGAD